MCCVRRASNDADSFFLYKFDLVEVLLRYAALNDRTIVKMGLNKSNGIMSIPPYFIFYFSTKIQVSRIHVYFV
jgi:hypothetical protein